VGLLGSGGTVRLYAIQIGIYIYILQYRLVPDFAMQCQPIAIALAVSVPTTGPLSRVHTGDKVDYR